MGETTFKHGKYEVHVTWNTASDEAIRETAQYLVDKLEGDERKNERSRG